MILREKHRKPREKLLVKWRKPRRQSIEGAVGERSELEKRSTISVVVDTNVFVAAFWNKNSASAYILRACTNGTILLCYTQQIRKEIGLILRNAKSSERYRQAITQMLERGIEVKVAQHLSVVNEDPEDNKFLECAAAIGADYLITNDSHLLDLESFERTKIITPSEFRKIMQSIGHS